jgi:hypothetical protein
MRYGYSLATLLRTMSPLVHLLYYGTCCGTLMAISIQKIKQVYALAERLPGTRAR